MPHLPSSESAPAQRLLLPIDPGEESRGGIRYALNRAAAGDAIEVFLVHILPPVGHGDLLRFRAEQEDAEQLLKRANACLEAAAAPLLAAGVPCHTFVREADPVQGIRDLAEEWACTEVVLPYGYSLDAFHGGQRRKLKLLEQTLRITWVGGGGFPGKDSHAP